MQEQNTAEKTVTIKSNSLYDKLFGHYSIRNLLLMFFIFGAVGKAWEIVYVRITEGVWANRGLMYGPYVPIYAVGGILIILFFDKFRKKPWIVFILSTVVCTVIEYITAVVIEKTLGHRLWQYDTQILNYKSRICLLASLGFGAAGTFQACLFAPFVNKYVSRLKKSVIIVLDIVLWTIFITDFIFSVFICPKDSKGATYPLLSETENQTETVATVEAEENE